jgi:hypothetical protein
MTLTHCLRWQRRSLPVRYTAGDAGMHPLKLKHQAASADGCLRNPLAACVANGSVAGK